MPIIATAVATMAFAIQDKWGDPRIPMPNPWRDPGYMKVVWIQSPNFDLRPADAVIDTIVIHSTVIPTLERTTVAFQRPESKVSAHFSIGKDGSIVQNVSTFDRAWHAGVSTDVNGRSNLNHYSVGIEIVNLNDGKDSYPQAQLDAVAAIVKVIMRRHPIKQICSHEYIADPQGEKVTLRTFLGKSLKASGFRCITVSRRSPKPVPKP